MANFVQGIGGPAPADPAPTPAGSLQPIAEQPSQAVSNGNASQPISDATDLSSLGNFIKLTTGAASSLKSFRSSLVASLKAQIGSGDYHPDPDAVAARVAAGIRV